MDHPFREDQEHLRVLLDSLQAGVVIALPGSGRIIEANPAAAEMLGGVPDDLYGRTILDHLRCPGFALQTTTDLLSLPHGSQRYLLRLDGGEAPVLMSAKAVDFGSQPHVLVSLTDVSEWKRVEEEHMMLSTAAESAAEAILITDREGRIKYVNPAFETITGYTRDEVLGGNPRILKSGQHPEHYYSAMWEDLVAGKTWVGRFTNRRKDGSLYEEEDTISPILDSAARITSYVAVKHDVTQRNQLAEQLRQTQKMEAVGNLAGGVAHDFNNILMVITNYTEFVKSALPDDDESQEDLDEVLKAATRASNLTRQLLAFSRRQVIAPRPADLNEIVADMEKMLRRLIGETITLEVRPDETIGLVKVDPGQIEQVLANLLVNARDAMQDGGVVTLQTGLETVDDQSASLYLDGQPGEYAVLMVTDSGSGMTDEVKSRVFEPFFTTKEEGRGTGLGLAMVYGIVKQHSGFIHLESRLGIGTTFRVFLPLADEGACDVSSDVRPAVADGGSETVLVVEDEVTVRQTMVYMLQKLGYRVLQADNGKSGLKTALENRDDLRLLVTDVVMPEMGGKALADVVKSMMPQVKIILASGYPRSHLATHYNLSEDIRVLQKPFTVTSLSEMVREALDG
ncbi:MAG: PAS domain S-box protein [Lentisphaerae bacterium]|jgi:two-component system, cell cycle sensor histidine kinase and response regulator CckA|nr:PAS domain S-box protein [Lentisphaerota bacterium]MBT4819293.1 PAS domain S-box protein [Lentisphaerota bacterium]MBT5610545.1 PAS domain S-box protein [Lentisphaerota bacterium]MBT7054417.1 PAS domain S-box protein [Lentisphaerota bacterium]MBT7842586.1 PAS domain S-box protein [Lentisphaerota bacterium]